MDSRARSGENHWVLGAGASRREIARTLNAAYAGGLLSEDTFVSRLDQLFAAKLIEPLRLIGDLSLRVPEGASRRRPGRALLVVWRRVLRRRDAPVEAVSVLLALDWEGGQRELLVGRHHTCDVVLADPSVSRRHARLLFRDGIWILRDLESTNGTIVNGVRVGRCEIRPGDQLLLGDEPLRVD
jgi:hypothetical protein